MPIDKVSRLKSIKTALTEKLNNHPLSSANTAVFGSDLSQENPSAGYESMPYFGLAPAAADTLSPKRRDDGQQFPKCESLGSHQPQRRGHLVPQLFLQG